MMLKSGFTQIHSIEAEEFGAHHNLRQEPQEYFKTERRWKRHLEGLELDKHPQVSEDFVGPKGTVGAVALDVQGNLAAATSTGGKTNKLSSRLGDTPLIGCGTYAENGLVACSGTGDGEFFIRSVASYDIAAQMKYATQLKSTKNPIQLAQLILEKQPNTHGFLCGEEAEEFGALHNLPQEPQEYFKTERRWRQHLEGLELDKSPQVSEDFRGPKGTVGAVALDVQGNLAAATSTGGKTNKMDSRLGDTPLIGCGTYAENGLVACSGTGDGEFFIRSVASYDIAAQMKYAGKSVQDASKFTLKSIEDLGGSGGLIALDSEGRFAMPNSGGMFRGWIGQDGVSHTAIFVDEEC
ncbi:hypothetical protein CcCBS67573_g09359 [Chytriomyces confervae]|uniref:beta-aspartyl-peptidase n=1 Tax=Chytriomyces confervae TaxID=246404 RepID=A0A507DZY0_9FUNG|nr:hypothetical protein CcCBS67573_g09359 [Chytriomyces confervae]